MMKNLHYDYDDIAFLLLGLTTRSTLVATNTFKATFTMLVSLDLTPPQPLFLTSAALPEQIESQSTVESVVFDGR